MKNLIWLASYPKSGNTWLRVFLSNYFSDLSSPLTINALSLNLRANDNSLLEKFADIEPSDLNFKELLQLRSDVFKELSLKSNKKVFLKIHDAFQDKEEKIPFIPKENTFGIIYLIRNPLDVAVSFSHHEGKPIDEIINFMADEEAVLGNNHSGYHRLSPEKLTSWSSHVNSWTNSGIRLLLVRYEDLLENPYSAFQKVAHFIDGKVSPEKLEKAIRFSDFSFLQKQEEKEGFKEKNMKTLKFFRKGKSGGWKKELNKEHINQIIKNHDSVMKKYGYL